MAEKKAEKKKARPKFKDGDGDVWEYEGVDNMGYIVLVNKELGSKAYKGPQFVEVLKALTPLDDTAKKIVEAMK